MNEKQLLQMEGEMYSEEDFEPVGHEVFDGVRYTVYAGMAGESNRQRPMIQLLYCTTPDGDPVGGQPMRIVSDDGDGVYVPVDVCHRCYNLTWSDCPEHPEGYVDGTDRHPTAEYLAEPPQYRRSLPW